MYIGAESLQSRTCSLAAGSGDLKRPATVAWPTSSSSRRSAWNLSSGACLFNLGFSEGSWLSLARVHLANYDSHDAAPANWTRACTGPQLLYLEFCENLVYGTTFDSCLRSLVKNSTDVRCLEKQAGISETLAEIKALVDADVAEAEAASEDE